MANKQVHKAAEKSAAIVKLEAEVGYEVRLKDGEIVYRNDGTPARKKHRRSAAEVISSQNSLVLRKLVQENQIPAEQVAQLIGQIMTPAKAGQ